MAEGLIFRKNGHHRHQRGRLPLSGAKKNHSKFIIFGFTLPEGLAVDSCSLAFISPVKILQLNSLSKFFWNANSKNILRKKFKIRKYSFYTKVTSLYESLQLFIILYKFLFFYLEAQGLSPKKCQFGRECKSGVSM